MYVVPEANPDEESDPRRTTMKSTLRNNEQDINRSEHNSSLRKGQQKDLGGGLIGLD